MTCCGKLKKVASITQGNLAVVLDRVHLLPAERYLYHALRLQACRACEHQTFLTMEQYINWINDNGGIESFLAEVDDLDRWPPLPIINEAQSQPGAKLYCSLCKCWLEAKAYVKQENCPVGHPDWRKPSGLFKASPGD